MTEEDDAIVQEFLIESHENLDQLDRELVQLEQEPSSRELLSGIFRTIHTIKGASGFLAFGRLESLTHVGENLLSRLRDGDLVMTPIIADSLLAMVDTTRCLLDAIERTGGDTDESITVEPIVAAIRDILAGTGGSVPAVAPAEPPPAPELEPEPEPEPTVPTPEVVHSGRPTDTENDHRRASTESTVRVDVELLDTLVRLVGELVLTRNQIMQQSEARLDPELQRTSQRLNLVASELQESVMKTRMQPIGQVWAKLPRVVRDLSAQLGRQVRLELEGQDTELDRSLLEAVKDPLTHLVRNAIDHGIEPAADRIAKGKPAAGVLALRAFHESGQVVVEISDDGKGLDSDHIGRIAVERDVVTSDALRRMSPRETVDLIFRPGFSTAATVSNVSGRGVGMDVVRTNIERIGGTVDLASHAGTGTTVRVRIPLTLAIIPALVVGEGSERFAIPQTNLVELVRLDNTEIERGVETIAGAPLIRLRGELLPLVSLAATLDLPESCQPERQTVIVLQADDTRFGLLVSQVHDTQEIVVKPIGRQLKAVVLYAGATIMGDGKVALILDVAGLAQSAQVATVAARHKTGTADEVEASRAVLVLDVGTDRRAALPLGSVSRLEEIETATLERSGDVEVVQYRGGVLPLIRLADAIGVPVGPEADTLSVIVHGDGADRVGIVVERVVDIVETTTRPHRAGARTGVLGSAVIQDRVTDLVDVEALVGAAGVRR